MSRRLAGLAAGLLMAGLYACDPAPNPSSTAAPDAEAPAQILKNFEMQDIQGGVRSMLLQSVEGKIFEQQHMAELKMPSVTFYKHGAVSSVMTSPSGRVNMETHQIEAWGGVTVVTPDSATLTTERLQYDPKLKKILSKEAVHLEKPDSITDGVGLEADPDLTVVKIGKQHVRFKSNFKP